MDILDTVKRRLSSWGFGLEPQDDISLEFIAEKTRQFILDDCNISSLPLELHPVWSDRILGEFLRAKRAVCPSFFEDIDMDSALKSIREGDTELRFAVSEGEYLSPEQRLDLAIEALSLSGKAQLCRYRRMAW